MTPPKKIKNKNKYETNCVTHGNNVPSQRVMRSLINTILIGVSPNLPIHTDWYKYFI
jgi:CRISPR/Cas system CMR-associated protein Cmr3 (group 5 of RAMP superfamily)